MKLLSALLEDPHCKLGETTVKLLSQCFHLLSCIKADLSVFYLSLYCTVFDSGKLHKLQTSESKQHVLNKTVTWTNADTDPAVSYVKGFCY